MRDLVKRQCKSFRGVKTEDVVEVHLSEAAKNDKKKIHRCGAPLKNLLCDLFHPFDHVSELHDKKHGLERTHLKSVAKNNELSSSLSFGRGQKTVTLDVIEGSEVKFDSTNVEDYVSELSGAKFTPMFLGLFLNMDVRKTETTLKNGIPSLFTQPNVNCRDLLMPRVTTMASDLCKKSQHGFGEEHVMFPHMVVQADTSDQGCKIKSVISPADVHWTDGSCTACMIDQSA
jgi:hypothetical protein